MSHIDEQICRYSIQLSLHFIASVPTYLLLFRLRVKFDPLCAHLEEAYERKKTLLETLDQCVTDEKKVTAIVNTCSRS